MSNVFFSSNRSKNTVSPLSKIKKLLNKCGIKEKFIKGDLIAVKLHFGEYGNTAFLRPIYVRPVIERLKEIKTNPYLTDTNTLYIGMRSNSVDHIHNAALNGYNYSTLQTPVIIADGLKGENYTELSLKEGEYIKTAKIATDIVNANGMIMLSHFKGHEFTGFGGAIKNLSMGCASRAGKLEMHSCSKPVVKENLCTACGRCKQFCNANAIDISGVAHINDNCTGCTTCIGVCPEHAVGIAFDNSKETVQRFMAEYAVSVHNHFKGSIIYINFLNSIVPSCDCMPGNDAPVVSDIGFMASTDPLALDKASIDIVTEKCGHYPFTESGNAQLEQSYKVGLGSLEYKLVNID